MRGQAHTLEATIASLLLLSAIIFALQMTAVTPLSASTSSQHIENQQRSTAEGVLATAAEEDALKPALLYWNESRNPSRFHNGTEGEPYYTGGSEYPNHRFGQLLNRAFSDNGIAYNVNLRFAGVSADPVQYIYSGEPSDNAVTASQTIAIYDDEHLYDRDGTRNSTEVSSSDYNSTLGFTPDSSSTLHATVRVEVVVWQI